MIESPHQQLRMSLDTAKICSNYLFETRKKTVKEDLRQVLRYNSGFFLNANWIYNAVESKDEVNIQLPVAKKEKENLFLLAAQGSCLALIKTLLDKRVDVNTQNETGHTALIYAVQNNNLQLVELLLTVKGIKLDLEANCDVLKSQPGKMKRSAGPIVRQKTAFEFAIENSNRRIARLLLDHGANKQFKWDLSLHNSALEVLLVQIIQRKEPWDKKGPYEPFSSYAFVALMKPQLNMLLFLLLECIHEDQRHLVMVFLEDLSQFYHVVPEVVDYVKNKMRDLLVTRERDRWQDEENDDNADECPLRLLCLDAIDHPRLSFR
jgi:hypothetical protein